MTSLYLSDIYHQYCQTPAIITWFCLVSVSLFPLIFPFAFMIYTSIFDRLSPLTIWQSYDYPSANSYSWRFLWIYQCMDLFDLRFCVYEMLESNYSTMSWLNQDVDIMTWLSNYTPHATIYVINYYMPLSQLLMILVKEALGPNNTWPDST